MRVGMVGLAALYWPIALGRGLQASQDVAFVAAATLGAHETAIEETLGMTAAAYAEQFQLRLYRDAADMVEQERLDTVVLATRHTEHAIWAERMAALGVDIFIPKTFATSAEDADRIVQAQQRHAVNIAVGPSARFLPPFVAAKRALDQGLIGEPFAVRICHHHGTIDVFHKTDWYRDPQEGGPELSLGWYGIDLVLHLMEDTVRTVYADYGNFTSPDSPFMDCGRISLRLARGGLASFDMYFCNRVPYPAWQMEILGPHGVLSIQRTAENGTHTVVSANTAAGYQILPVPEATPGWETFWIEDFKAGRKAALSAEQANLITRISLAARQSAATAQPVHL
jgi:predicted dehydrogenase